ncbi:MAG: dTMP kinase [Candidatus Chisholmbacteria bacterium RIFCSPLOWO2_01_FULL_50_28]|uniref:Thymidylate kinase n=1 Tax=Candidatus Chisholmbacteria bacterium RIFCSPHIGHO2_01_FULL_52_32 TaxID=1797591 RepID=A0A1G1VS44_9BACT|nr:MAG: dTMP kinase [Candidatus Chisholmbacteria bacterium RIFCSPHIGHO2_01_FULL_52_32]OGY20398.1 MAG: dTMP kinase [Candidatus Chisholmbacteria bacterium RIFCSPLOWO2_01_FULL_50_28]
MKKGVLISFEGGEGSGKTVQIKRLRDRLTKAGKDVVVVREPGGTVISEQIREVLLSPKNIGMAYTTEVLLFQAARAQIFREIVLPSLAAGKVVLMDRSRDSSTVYQGMVRGFGVDLIEGLNELSTKKTYPDLTFLLDVPVETGLERRNHTSKMDRLDMEAREFHEQVRRGYLTLARKNDHHRWVIINSQQSIDAISERIRDEVRARKIV